MSTLTPFADMAPVPRVLVDVPVGEFPAGSATVSLTRTAEGRTFDVRGGVRLPASSPAIVIDHEAPFGVESSYTVVGYDAAGEIIGSLPVGSVTLKFSQTVVQQPLDPRLSVVVQLMRGTASSVSRPSPSGLAYPQGRVLPGMVGLGPRRGIQSVDLRLETATPEDTAALEATLGTYDTPQLPVWLIRASPTGDLPRVFFCHVPELVKYDTYLGFGPQTAFGATVTEVRPPAPGVTAAVLTYSDVDVFYDAYSDLGAVYGSYSDIKRDTSLIGAAGA